LVKQVIITENMLRNIREVGEKYYRDKGFQNVTVTPELTTDPTYANSKFMTIRIDKGGKVKIDEVNIYGNDHVDDLKIKKQMKGTKEMMKFTLFPSKMATPYGEKKNMTFGEYLRDWGFLSFSKTRKLLDPYFRVKLSSAKYNQVKYEEDKD